jgi:hypothetical protein
VGSSSSRCASLPLQALWLPVVGSVLGDYKQLASRCYKHLSVLDRRATPIAAVTLRALLLTVTVVIPFLMLILLLPHCCCVQMVTEPPVHVRLGALGTGRNAPIHALPGRRSDVGIRAVGGHACVLSDVRMV